MARMRQELEEQQATISALENKMSSVQHHVKGNTQQIQTHDAVIGMLKAAVNGIFC